MNKGAKIGIVVENGKVNVRSEIGILALGELSMLITQLEIIAHELRTKYKEIIDGK